jgi:hypothetical protein
MESNHVRHAYIFVSVTAALTGFAFSAGKC